MQCGGRNGRLVFAQSRQVFSRLLTNDKHFIISKIRLDCRYQTLGFSGWNQKCHKAVREHTGFAKGEEIAMESRSFDNSFLDEAKRMEQAAAALRRIATATRPELRQALDDYLAIIDGLGIEEAIATHTAALQGGSD